MKLDISKHQKTITKNVRYGIIIFIVGVIVFSPLQMAVEGSTQVTITDLLPHPSEKSGQELFRSIYRGVQKLYLPLITDDLSDLDYKSWSSLADIQDGLSYIENISAQNIDRPNLQSLPGSYKFALYPTN